MVRIRASEATIKIVLPLDPKCSACGGDHDIGEAIDGQGWRCRSCGVRLTAVEWTDGTMSMMARGAWRLDGRKRTRARWRRQGRR